MRLAWLTDIHLNFLSPGQIGEFLSVVVDREPDALLVTGDIGEAPSVVPLLEQIDDALARPIYFVLGNHDFYGGSIAQVRRAVESLAARRPNLHYLTALEHVELAAGVGLVGDDGWADARLGDYERSYVMMNDYRLIAELRPHNKRSRRDVLHQLGDASAAHIRRVLPAALAKFQHIVLATHVPPLREACWHEGGLSDDEWAPHFTCKAMGDAILETMDAHPDRRLTVYCGHTHSPGVCRPRSNVVIHTGGAQYGRPAVQMIELTWPSIE